MLSVQTGAVHMGGLLRLLGITTNGEEIEEIICFGIECLIVVLQDEPIVTGFLDSVC